MMLVHEAAERNGEGIPPFHVYTWLISVLIVWMFAMLALSVLNPLVVLAGIGAVVYFVARGIVRDQERRRIVEFWRAEGRCTNCGEPADRGNEYCINCGEEPDPDATRLRR